MVRAQQLDLTAEGGVPTVSAHASLSRATHVAYDVRVSGYLELFPDEAKYAPASSCCQGGMVAETCGTSYVTRLIRGSGTVQHLQKLDASAGVEAGELVRARGGTSYRRLNETSFVDAYFAYQLELLASLCSRLSPDDEMETLAVQAPNHGRLQRELRSRWPGRAAGIVRGRAKPSNSPACRGHCARDAPPAPPPPPGSAP